MKRKQQKTGLIQLFLLCAGSAVTVHGLPYMILTSTRSKCMSVIAPQGQTISIDYDAPDLASSEEEGEDKTAAAEEVAATASGDGNPANVSGGAGEDGFNNQWNKRMKERLERMKSQKMRDMALTVTQKLGLTGVLSSRQRRTYNKEGNSTVGQGRVREELTQRKGSIQFLTGEEDGTIEICIQSVLASIKNPARFALQVSMAVAEETLEEESEERTKDLDTLDHAGIRMRLGRLERDLQTLQNRVKACLNNADFNKDQEAAFHNQSIAMNRAATYWPIIQLMILIITGFTQANHIVRYLKAHHIGI